MIPSDMRLHIGVVDDYNNKILIATETQFGLKPKLGLNVDINNSPAQTRVSSPALHAYKPALTVNKKIGPAHTLHLQPQVAQTHRLQLLPQLM